MKGRNKTGTRMNNKKRKKLNSRIAIINLSRPPYINIISQIGNRFLKFCQT